MKVDKKYIILGILIVLFVILAILVELDLTRGLDDSFYGLIDGMINDRNTKIFEVITFFGSTGFMIALTVVLLFVWKKGRGGVKLASAMMISTALNNIIKVIIRRPRPEILQLADESTFSFPSGHTMAIVTLVAFVIYALWSSREKSSITNCFRHILTIALIVVALLVMFSRIYLGVHFITDIIGGALLSTIIVFSIAIFLEKKEA